MILTIPGPLGENSKTLEDTEEAKESTSTVRNSSLSFWCETFSKVDFNREWEDDDDTIQMNPDEAQLNNIDLGGVLNLAAEDTLNIRSSTSLCFALHYFSGSSCGTCTICGVFRSRSSPSSVSSTPSLASQRLWWEILFCDQILKLKVALPSHEFSTQACEACCSLESDFSL